MRAIEATESLEPLLAELNKGESLEIRRGNVTVAYLVPPRNAVTGKPIERDPAKIREAIQKLKELSNGVTLGGLNLKDLINEGRRY